VKLKGKEYHLVAYVCRFCGHEFVAPVRFTGDDFKSEFFNGNKSMSTQVRCDDCGMMLPTWSTKKKKMKKVK